MKPTIFLTSMLLACVMISCSSKGQNAGGNSMSFDSIVVNQQVLLCPEKADSIPYINISVNFKFPIAFSSQKDMKKLQKLFIQTTFGDSISETPQQAVEKHMAFVSKRYWDDFKEDYLTHLEEDESGEFPMYIYMHRDVINNTIKHATPSFISISNYAYRDFAGTHSASFITNRSIDLTHFSILTEESLYVPGYENQPKKIIQAGLIDYVRKKTDSTNSSDDYLKQYFFDFDEIKPNSNFYLNDNGVKYVYNVYEIAPYASGRFEVNIAYNEIKSLLKPDVLRELSPAVSAKKETNAHMTVADNFPSFLSEFLGDCWWNKNFNTLLRKGDKTLAKYIDPQMDIRRYYAPGTIHYLGTRAEDFGFAEYDDFETTPNYAGEYAMQQVDADFKPCSFEFDFSENRQVYYRTANGVPDVVVDMETFETAPVELAYPNAEIKVVYLPDKFSSPRAFYFIATPSGWKLAFVNDALCSA